LSTATSRSFRKAVYPDNVFVRWSDGSCGCVVWPGKSGREGTTLPGAQQYLTSVLGATDAVLLDNGGDVRPTYRGGELVRSSVCCCLHSQLRPADAVSACRLLQPISTAVRPAHTAGSPFTNEHLGSRQQTNTAGKPNNRGIRRPAATPPASAADCPLLT